MPIKVGDRCPRRGSRDDVGGTGVEDHRRGVQGQGSRYSPCPGAFTGTCHKMHVPSILQNADAIKAKGVNTIAVTSVNDVFVMDAWRKQCAAEKLDFLADGNGEFAKAIDLAFDASGNGLGTCSQRLPCWSRTAW